MEDEAVIHDEGRHLVELVVLDQLGAVSIAIDLDNLDVKVRVRLDDGEDARRPRVVLQRRQRPR